MSWPKIAESQKHIRHRYNYLSHKNTHAQTKSNTHTHTHTHKRTHMHIHTIASNSNNKDCDCHTPNTHKIGQLCTVHAQKLHWVEFTHAHSERVQNGKTHTNGKSCLDSISDSTKCHTETANTSQVAPRICRLASAVPSPRRGARMKRQSLLCCTTRTIGIGCTQSKLKLQIQNLSCGLIIKKIRICTYIVGTDKSNDFDHFAK